MPEVGVVIAAGGKGTRMGTQTPKQFLRIRGRSVIEHVLSRFERLREVTEIVVVVPEPFSDRVLKMIRKNGAGKTTTVVPGGKERQDSVWKGINGFRNQPAIVLIHDAVRPLITPGIVRKVIKETELHRAAVVGVRVHDTIKREGAPGFYAETLRRDNLWAVQTPQGFAFTLLKEAHLRAQADGFLGTDDASLVERLGVPVRIVEGDRKNIKITSRHDLEIVQKWLKLR
jgi:2-C-methyl-D-erythritol 4-phosphate cytidylyltransferase